MVDYSTPAQQQSMAILPQDSSRTAPYGKGYLYYVPANSSEGRVTILAVDKEGDGRLDWFSPRLDEKEISKEQANRAYKLLSPWFTVIPY